MNTFPYVKDLVLIGGGHTHALVLRKWGMDPLPGVRLTVIDPVAKAAYSGMLPGFVAGHYTRDELDIDLVRLCQFAGARLIVGAAMSIDRVEGLIHVPGRPPVPYDVCALDVGITSDMPSLPGFREHAVPAKPLGPFATSWQTFRTSTQDPSLAIIGGGVAGAELAMAMTHALQADGHTPRVHLIDRSKALTALGARARARMQAALAAQNVSVLEDANVQEVTSTGVTLTDGRQIEASFVTGAAGAKPHDWQTKLDLTLEGGYIAVNAQLQSSDPAIFAVGDCAHLTASPRPKAGVFAVREAPVLFDNLRAMLSGGKLRAYVPQRDYLKLISLGAQDALAEKWGAVVSGPMLWRWKDQIDRKFMDQFEDLPKMGLPAIPAEHADGLRDAMGDKPMCGGCGAKVGPATLKDALASLPAPVRDDVTRMPGDDAGVITIGSSKQVITTDHLRAFVADPYLTTKIAATHALGDIWAMGASPQAATVNLILPQASDKLHHRMMVEIMAAAQEVLTRAGADIVGGHTSVGAELTVGFTLTGLSDATPIGLDGSQPGDALIITKPVGSGVLMAASMARLARGEHVVAALELMSQGQAKAAEILCDAHAMTDVTGFGLAGHLQGICQASAIGAEVDLAAVPLMQGALDLARLGVRSTLFAANRQGATASDTDTPMLDLMYDPQTAGGLLAAYPADKADDGLARLKAAGYNAAIIGRTTSGAGVSFLAEHG